MKYIGAGIIESPRVGVDEFFQNPGTPRIIAHRGGGGEFPEHTMAAYESSVAAGCSAIEVSVQITADGILVCHHDTTLDRMTDHTGLIEDWTYAALREKVRVKAQGLLGTGWSDQVIPTLEEVLDRFLGRVMIFLEPKSNPSVSPFQDFLTQFYPEANRSVVIKGFYLSTAFPWAHDNGFKTWGYYFEPTGVTSADLDAQDANVDMWGPPKEETDANLSMVLSRGKIVVVHVIQRHHEIQRLQALGAQNFMAANPIYLKKMPQMKYDQFMEEVSIPGTLGVVDYAEDYALKFDGVGAAYINHISGASVLRGGNVAPADDGYVIKLQMGWPTLPSSTSLHGDVAFGRVQDHKYEYFSTSNESGGYSMYFRANGEMQLYEQTAFTQGSAQLGTLMTEAAVAGAYMSFEIEVTATQVILRRTDTATPYELIVNNTTHRGRYWHISNGSISDLAQVPFWKAIDVGLVV